MKIGFFSQLAVVFENVGDAAQSRRLINHVLKGQFNQITYANIRYIILHFGGV